MRPQKETIRIHDINLCSEQDLEDIHALLIAARALIILTKQQRLSSSVQAWVMHALGIGNGILAIKNAYNDSTKLFALLYLPVIFYCAYIGFSANNISQISKTELQDYQNKYKSLIDVIQQVTPPEIHDIAKIYRTEVPKGKEDEITIEAIQKAIRYILIKYQR